MEYPGFCGGFVWEWCDHAVYGGTTPDNRPILTGTAGTSGNSPTTGTSAWTAWSTRTAPPTPACWNIRT